MLKSAPKPIRDENWSLEPSNEVKKKSLNMGKKLETWSQSWAFYTQIASLLIKGWKIRPIFHQFEGVAGDFRAQKPFEMKENYCADKI